MVSFKMKGLHKKYQYILRYLCMYVIFDCYYILSGFDETI